MKQIILCADDYAYNERVSNSIIQLIELGRLSATSCMTNMPNWPAAAKKLKPFRFQVDIGLHFNLSEGPVLSSTKDDYFLSLSKLKRRCFLRRASKEAIALELRMQLDAFTKHFGQLPDYIDGHQHVQQFPVVRDALLEVYDEYFPNKEAYIRLSSNPYAKAATQSRRCPKMIVIALTGTSALRKQLIKRGIPHNKSFSGVYDFNPEADFGKLFQVFLSEVENKGLIMCHPCKAAEENQNDPIALARMNEFNYLASEQFKTDNPDLVICRF